MKKHIPADCKVFIDTCSLMHPATWLYVPDVLIPALKRDGISVVVPLHVLDELRKLQLQKDETGAKASSGLATVALMLSSGVLELVGNGESDTFADNYFLYTFVKLRLKHNLALITQDKKLAQDIQDLGNHRSVQGRKKIKLLKIENDQLVEWEFNSNNYVPEKKTMFDIYTHPRQKRGTIIPIDKVPSTGDAVYSDKFGKILLGKQAVVTESGRIFLCPGGLACKVYNEKYLDDFQRRKISKMLEIEVQIPGVCWPLDMAYDQYDNFVGYIMPEFKGRSMNETVFSKKHLEKNFPHWRRLELVCLCLTWLNKVKKLHDINVLVGGINPSHILVINEKEMFLIETDAFQVEIYPCPQSNMDYIAPELRSNKPGTYLQTKEQEYYAIATLLFMTLLPGKHPFSCRNGKPAAKVRSLEFPYPLGDKTNHNTPGKPWVYIWSNLPYKIKQLFFNVFSEEQRISVNMWLKNLYEYRHLLSNGHMNNELFPESRKIINPCQVICTRCGIVEMQEEKWFKKIKAKGQNYYCNVCLADIRRENQHGDNHDKDINNERPGQYELLAQGV